MGTIYNAFHKIVPFSAWFQALGLSEAVSQGLSILLIALLIWLLTKVTSLLWQRWKNQKTASDLKPQFDYQMVRQATRYYIPTQYQNASPARQDEPGFTHKYVSRSLLIPFFNKTAFNERVDSERFYLILADSGMGKTTFMINLYIRYHSFFNRHRKYKMRLFRFSHPDTLTEIRAIKSEEARNTILLLDALDEDRNIVSKDPNISDAQAFQNRVDEIIAATRNFCEVVMTCRTQYFPGQEDDPYELKIKRPDEKGYYILNKLYISPFNEKEVKQYLNKKFGYLPLRNRAKKKRAAQVVGQARHLVMRPMMLSYIDYLLEDNRSFQSNYDIYETLIEKWLIRETKKRKNLSNQKVFMDNLRLVSQQTAVAIFHNWQAENRLYLTKEEALAIAIQHEIDLKPEEVTGQSLLTCDGSGYWKFAHKSILEFFLAKEAIENTDFLLETNFTGMDMARRLVREFMPEFTPIKGGEFLMGSPLDEHGREEREAQHEVRVNDFYMSVYTITLGQFEVFIKESKYQTDADKGGGSFIWTGKKWEEKTGINWRFDTRGKVQENKNHPVIHVSWNDATAYSEWLGRKIKRSVRLPTEAEWEYACRAGTITSFNTGDNLTTKQANYNGNRPYNNYPKGEYVGHTQIVGNYPANAWGLYDMHGNVWEWCQDWFDEKYYDECKNSGVVENPSGPASGSARVVRGGSWSRNARYCRAADRGNGEPDDRDNGLGFRLVFVL